MCHHQGLRVKFLLHGQANLFDKEWQTKNNRPLRLSRFVILAMISGNDMCALPFVPSDGLINPEEDS